MNAVAADLHRRAHRAAHVEVEAQAVAVTLQRAAERGAHLDRDLAIEGAAFDRIHLHHRRIHRQRRTDLARVKTVIRIERRLDAAQLLVQRFPEEFRAVLGAEPLAMLAPQQAAVFGGERHHPIGDLLHQHFLLGVAHVERRTHVQHPGIDVAEHAIAQLVVVEQLAELDDIVRQVLRRHASILGERDRLGAPFGVAQQPDRLLAHVVNALDARQVAADLVPDHAGLPLGDQFIQPLAQGLHLAVDQRAVVAGEFDDVQPKHLFIRHVGDQFAYRMPNDIFTRQIQHLGVDGFHRQRLGLDHKGRIAQRRVEGVVFHVNQTTHLRQRRNVQPRFGDKGQRAFRTGEDARQIEGLQIVAQHVAQVVAGEEAVEFGEFFQDQRALLAAAIKHRAVDAPFGGLFQGNRFRQRRRHGAGVDHLAAQQHRPQAQHVIGGFTVYQRALAGGVGVDHAAQGGAVAGGQFRREEVAERPQILIQLILDDPGFDFHPALFDVDLQNAVHMTRHIDHDAGI